MYDVYSRYVYILCIKCCTTSETKDTLHTNADALQTIANACARDDYPQALCARCTHKESTEAKSIIIACIHLRGKRCLCCARMHCVFCVFFLHPLHTANAVVCRYICRHSHSWMLLPFNDGSNQIKSQRKTK